MSTTSLTSYRSLRFVTVRLLGDIDDPARPSVQVRLQRAGPLLGPLLLHRREPRRRVLRPPASLRQRRRRLRPTKLDLPTTGSKSRPRLDLPLRRSGRLRLPADGRERVGLNDGKNKLALYLSNVF